MTAGSNTLTFAANQYRRNDTRGLAGFLEERLSVPVAVLDLFNATGHLAGVDVEGPT